LKAEQKQPKSVFPFSKPSPFSSMTEMAACSAKKQ